MGGLRKKPTQLRRRSLASQSALKKSPTLISSMMQFEKCPVENSLRDIFILDRVIATTFSDHFPFHSCKKFFKLQALINQDIFLKIESVTVNFHTLDS